MHKKVRRRELPPIRSLYLLIILVALGVTAVSVGRLVLLLIGLL
jgi:hypothetical protein